MLTIYSPHTALRMFLFISLIFLGICAFPLQGHGDKIPSVVIVHSYGPDHICGKPQSQGIQRAFAEKYARDAAVRFHHVYMRTKKLYTSKNQIRERGKLAIQEINRIRPDMVITLDDNAFSTVGLALAGHPEIRVVFCGLNNAPERYNAQTKFMQSRTHPGGNITGIFEKLYVCTSLKVIKRILPRCKKVVGITDYSPTGDALSRQFASEIRTEELPVAWEVRRVASFEAYKKLIFELNADPEVQAIYPAALTLTQGAQRVTASEILSWTVLHSTCPEIPLNYAFSKIGLFGGAAVNFESMGYAAGIYAIEILEGKKAGDLPIVDAPEYALIFNTARAASLNITIPQSVLLASDAVYTSLGTTNTP